MLAMFARDGGIVGETLDVVVVEERVGLEVTGRGDAG